MQSVEVSRELALAISQIENMLNGTDGEQVLKMIRRYKKSGNLDNYRLRQRVE